MEGDEIQPTRISKDEYVKFKQYVQDVHGKTRGHLSTEIENALREYRQPDNSAEPIQRIENDIATIKARLADAEADGGVADLVAPPSDSDDSHTHTRKDKPEPNAPRSKKIEYFVETQMDDSGSSHVDEIQRRIKKTFGFEDRTATKYVEPIIEELDGKLHPNNTDLVIWGDRIDAVREGIEKGIDDEPLEEIPEGDE